MKQHLASQKILEKLPAIPPIFLKVLEHEDFIPNVVAEVSNGGSLLDLASRLKIPYSDCVRFIHQCPVRKATYEGVLTSRGEWYVQKIMNELKAISFVDLREAFNEDGTLKPISEMPEHITRVIAGIEVVENKDEEGNFTGYTKKVKMIDKMKALELLGKHLHLFAEKVVHSGHVEVVHKVQDYDLEERLKQLRERRASPQNEKVVDAEFKSAAAVPVGGEEL